MGILLSGFLTFTARAAFTSLYVFGDSISTTTNNTTPYPSQTNFYGHRYSNGRVWVEVLAQRQGMNYDSNKNWSYFNNYSATTNNGTLLANVSSFHAPADSNTALFVVWVNSADLYDDIALFGTNSMNAWTSAINRAQTNHFKVITNLYAKGVRTLVMPNAVDITGVPFFANTNAAYVGFVRQRCVDYNTAFSNTLNQARALCPDLKIYVPDFFSLIGNMLTNAPSYGLTNAGIDALDDSSLKNKSTNGPGANYIFWDDLDPTARSHEVMADVAQQSISRVQISQLTLLVGSNRLDMANIPIGLSGFVDGSTNLAQTNWTSVQNINSTNASETIFVTNSGPLQFYRLRFPYAWSWP